MKDENPGHGVFILHSFAFILAFILYAATAAPGYTWANFGADGGDLLAAAATNGVPHPSGYPLYTLLLQLALGLGAWLAPGAEVARIGNLLSAASAALAVAVTTHTIAALLGARRAAVAPAVSRFAHLLIPLAGGMAFGIAPLVWSQAVITEVYALHALAIAGLGWAVYTRATPLTLALVLGAGLAHHLTFALLIPAALYAWRPQGDGWRVRGQVMLAALFMAGLFYLRAPWVAGAFDNLLNRTQTMPSPVLWGYPDHWTGFWWLISGAAYQPLVWSVPLSHLPGRLLAAGSLLIAQYTIAGALLALWGFYRGQQQDARTWRVAALWIAPPLLYAASYNTADSFLYLLPVVWMLACWLGLGLYDALGVLAGRFQARAATTGALLACLALIGLGLARFPAQNLRHDDEARRYIQRAARAIPADSLVLTRTDAHTFALWYAAWATDTWQAPKQTPAEQTSTLQTFPEQTSIVLVNVELYHYDWYRRLLAARTPDLAGLGAPLPDFVAQNAPRRAIWLTEPFEELLPGQKEADGVLWRYSGTE